MQLDKWVEGVDPEGPAAEAARRALEQRLTSVWNLLPLAAHYAKYDVEYVHGLRVATRRSVAALRLFEPLLPKKSSRRLLRDLRRLRAAAGNARDLDVMLARQANQVEGRGKGFIKALRSQRVEAQQPILAEWERLACRGRYSHLAHQVLSGIGSGERSAGQQSFRAFARERLGEVTKQFLEAEPGESPRLAELHRFRILGKRLRYAMEVLAPAFPREFGEELYPMVENLQDYLGDLNDHAVAAARLEAWLEEKGEGVKGQQLRELLAREHHLLDEALDGFRVWKDLGQRDRLVTGLEKLLANTEHATS